jgi:DNA sulfur modification protein DndD
LDGIIFKEIRFENYRQYGTGTLRFDCGDQYNLFVLTAQNGTGKTTLLNAITWCLYSEEPELVSKSEKTGKNKGLPVLNSEILAKSPTDSTQNVKVTLVIEDGDIRLEFSRQQVFTINKAVNNVKQAIPGKNQLTVSKTINNSLLNTEIKTGAEADLIVNQYFDHDIYDFYFFDGEKLEKFFKSGREEDIKNSIYKISQVTLLENVCNRTKILQKDYTSKLSKDSPMLDDIKSQIDNKEKGLNRTTTDLDSTKDSLEEYHREKKTIGEELRKIQPIKELQEERDDLEQRADRLEVVRENILKEQSKFIREYTYKIKLYPRMKKILDYISDKEKIGELPPRIDIEEVKEILSYLDSNEGKTCNCPLCDHKIDASGKKHLQNLLDKVSVSSRTSNFLNFIQGTLQKEVETTKLYPKKREEFKSREDDNKKELSRINNRLQEISSYLINYQDEDYSNKRIAKLEERRNELENKISLADRSIGVDEEKIRQYNKDISGLNKQLNDAISRFDQHEKEKRKRDILGKIHKDYKTILSDIVGGMKREIESTTIEYFNRMNWKTHTFGKIRINDDYSLSVYDQYGQEMTTTLGATEKMALAYSFVLAIHKVSGKNCPWVIDSPIGRSSDENKDLIVSALLEISKEKQLILLFTPDDYSENVRKICSGKAVVKKVRLSDDEKFVEGMDE